MIEDELRDLSTKVACRQMQARTAAPMTAPNLPTTVKYVRWVTYN